MSDDSREPRWKEMHAARLREAIAFFTPEAFWSQLSVSEALSLVQAMPKMASKWDDRPRDSYRYSVKGSLVAHIWTDGSSWYGMKRDDVYAALEELGRRGQLVNLGTEKAPKLRLQV